MYPIKVLHVVGKMDRGGLETLIMNLYRNIDTSKVQFDFLVQYEEEGAFDIEIRKLGGTIHYISNIRKVGPLKYIRELKKFFNKNKSYKIVHSHVNAMSGLVLREAKKAGIKTRIAHSHIAYPKMGVFESIYKNYSKKFILKSSTYKFACSDVAAQYMYGKNVDLNTINIIKNGVDLDKFKYDRNIYETKRKELGIKNDEFVIGHIGRFNQQKNHQFLIEIFKEFRKYSNSKLVLVGDGSLEDYINEKIKAYGLLNDVMLLGSRDDVNELINIFDIMVFPSLYEGLPVTLIEAQANGLNCLISDTISKQVDMDCGKIEFYSLNKSAREWAEKIQLNKINNQREDTYEILNLKGYNIKNTAKELEKWYINEIKKQNGIKQ